MALAVHDGTGVRGDDRGDLLVVGPGEQDGPAGLVEQLADDRHALLGASCPGP